MDRGSIDQWLSNSQRHTLVMGVLNITPDSFSDGGKYFDHSAACQRAGELIEQGVDIIDIGGESTRPGSENVSVDEQIRRVVPVIRWIREQKSPSVISIDTRQSAVAEAALEAGAHLVNDISAGRDDAAMFPLAAKRKCPIVLMHMQGTPATMQNNPSYADVLKDVKDFLGARIAAAKEAGIAEEKILIDPGIGFGKTLEHDLQLLRGLKELSQWGRPIVLGVSRKKFIGRITGVNEPAGRIFGTAAAIAWGVANGVGVVRVHDVREMKQVVQVMESIVRK
ncbi:MAG TPA: dihydropteroate synthase [Tepidisphaeraceae bacterium]